MSSTTDHSRHSCWPVSRPASSQDCGAWPPVARKQTDQLAREWLVAFVRRVAFLRDARLLVAPSAEHIMAMPAEARRRWTPEVVRELMERQPGIWPRYELIDGELLVTPAPRLQHERVVFALIEILMPYVRREKLGRVLGSPSDLQLREKTITQPDVYVVPGEQDATARSWSDIKRLLLTIEVLSPSTARHDRGGKRKHYQEAGVDEYWILDMDSRVVERWLPNDLRPEVISDQLVWHPKGARSSLTIELVELWHNARLEDE